MQQILILKTCVFNSVRKLLLHLYFCLKDKGYNYKPSDVIVTSTNNYDVALSFNTKIKKLLSELDNNTLCNYEFF